MLVSAPPVLRPKILAKGFIVGFNVVVAPPLNLRLVLLLLDLLWLDRFAISKNEED